MVRIFILLTVLAACSKPVPTSEKMQAYFIGNSLTMSLTLDRVRGLMGQKDIDLHFGSQLAGGTGLLGQFELTGKVAEKAKTWELKKFPDGTWQPDGPFKPKQPDRYGLAKDALKNFHWDALVLNSYYGNIREDFKASTGFIDIALKNKGVDHIYTYMVWPQRKKLEGYTLKDPKCINIDFPDAWLKEYTCTVQDTHRESRWYAATRSYHIKLHRELQQHYPAHKDKFHLVPIGEVLYVLDGMIKKGELPGIEMLAERVPALVPGLANPGTKRAHGANLLYADSIHLNLVPHLGPALGIFVSGTTMATALSNQSQAGVSAAAYGLDDEQDKELIKAIQTMVWDVVQQYRDPQ